MPARSPRPLALVAAVVVGPAVAFAIASGCGPKPTPVPPVAGDAAVEVATGDAAPSALPEVAIEASTSLAPHDAGPVIADTGPVACWKGWAPTGNAVPDVQALGARCAVGMSQIGQPVKHVFKAGEEKTFPMPLFAGCYRIIAVGGTGVKDVDLALKDPTGKIIAADLTPDDIYPMIHPNREFCVDAFQLLNLSIIVKKGTGEVAGGVWKR